MSDADNNARKLALRHIALQLLMEDLKQAEDPVACLHAELLDAAEKGWREGFAYARENPDGKVLDNYYSVLRDTDREFVREMARVAPDNSHLFTEHLFPGLFEKKPHCTCPDHFAMPRGVPEEHAPDCPRRLAGLGGRG